MAKSGIRITHAPDMVGETETLRPLRDQIIVKPLKWEPSKIIEVVGSKRKPLRGVVIAAGPGHYPKIYNKDRSKSWDSTQFLRCEVKPGDVVELGGLEIDGYLFPQLLIGNEAHVICREADVAVVIE
jgi:co-chaperonin GroES (HSP10)